MFIVFFKKINYGEILGKIVLYLEVETSIVIFFVLKEEKSP